MAKYRIIFREIDKRYCIQRKYLFGGWVFVDNLGIPTAEGTWYMYPTYERAEEDLREIIEKKGKYKIIKEVEVNDKLIFSKIKVEDR